MGEHSEKVEYRRKVINAELWAKKVKKLEMIKKKSGKKTWETLYNDGSSIVEHFGKDGLANKKVKTDATLSIDECIQEMGREEADAVIGRY